MTSVRLSDAGREVVAARVTIRGWNKMSMVWVDFAEVSESTLKRFWQQRPIRIDNFMRIAKAAGIDDWQSIVAPENIELDESEDHATPDLKVAVVIAGKVSATNVQLVEMLLDALSEHLQTKPFRQMRKAEEGGKLLCFNGTLTPNKLGEVEALVNHIKLIEPELRETLQ